ncbi:Bax inhibitor-1/YccA family protein [Geminicoccaceae bacterium 1502E]|nr:Bax inhibitor-1/YccA family protein [Geminicoccaceae bacterium 1502E]
MAFRMDPRLAQARGTTVEQLDEGLRGYMLAVYNYMGLGLAITGLVALVVASTPALYVPIFTTPLKWVVMLAPLGFIFFLGARINSMSVSAAQLTFWLFAAVMGMSLASVFLVFTGESIARVFFITAATFGAVSLYGYTTKRDLSGFGSFLFMGLIGIVIASLVNLFLQSSALQFAVSVIGVLVFTGLTAYDSQRIKEEYYAGDAGDVAAKKSIMGALSLYLNFINLFMMLLQLFGAQRD